MRKRTFLFKVANKLLYWLCPLLSDKTYLKLMFRLKVGYPLNLEHPRTYNEKLQWLKLNDIHPEYAQLVDKVEAKKIVEKLIGEKYIIPTLGIWNTVDEIDWGSLPASFVIKCTNDSGGIVVCKDKSKLNINKAKTKLKRNWGKNYYTKNKEYPYRHLSPRIIAEEYLEDESGFELKDYKFFCFNGEPQCLFVATGRQKGDTRFDFYDLEWNHLPIINGHPNADFAIEKPKNFSEMVNVARQLSKGIPHVRIDLYNIKGEIYFGEMTFFHWSGTTPFEPIEWDYKLGDYIHLPNKTNAAL